MSKKKIKIFVICGEESGCNIIYNTLNQLNKNFDIELDGIFNKKIEEKFNSKPIFYSYEIAKMGFVSIITSIFSILKKIKTTKQKALEKDYDLILTVDSYDFCIRISKFIRKKKPKQKMIHIVSPSIWLYRKDRIKIIEKNYNALLCIFKEELEFYKNSNLPVYFIGNPTFDLFEENLQKDKNLISITIGSREEELIKHKKLIKDLIYKLLEFKKTLSFNILATPDTVKYLEEEFSDNKKVKIILDDNLKKESIENSYLAIAKSGSNVLDFIASTTPVCVFYKTSWLNAFLAFLIGVKYVNIINIFKKKELIKEFVQHKAKVGNIFQFCKNLLENENEYKKQLIILKNINKEYRLINNENSGSTAAKIIENIYYDKHI